MTADGQHILGPALSVRGFWFASGCNIVGLSIAPAVGEALAARIVEGRPPLGPSQLLEAEAKLRSGTAVAACTRNL